MKKQEVRQKLENRKYLVTGDSEQYGNVMDSDFRFLIALMNNGDATHETNNSAKIILYKHHTGGEELEEVLIDEGIPYEIIPPTKYRY